MGPDGKRPHGGAVLANGTTLVRGTVFSSNMIIKEKMAPLLKSGAVFQNGSRVEPFWLHFFFQWTIIYTKQLCLKMTNNANDPSKGLGKM